MPGFILDFAMGLALVWLWSRTTLWTPFGGALLRFGASDDLGAYASRLKGLAQAQHQALKELALTSHKKEVVHLELVAQELQALLQGLARELDVLAQLRGILQPFKDLASQANLLSLNVAFEAAGAASGRLGAMAQEFERWSAEANRRTADLELITERLEAEFLELREQAGRVVGLAKQLEEELKAFLRQDEPSKETYEQLERRSSLLVQGLGVLQGLIQALQERESLHLAPEGGISER
jgi:DNA repair exonuclease SbcCD ATPase subunit